jgi:hypothetical protein
MSSNVYPYIPQNHSYRKPLDMFAFQLSFQWLSCAALYYNRFCCFLYSDWEHVSTKLQQMDSSRRRLVVWSQELHWLSTPVLA